MDVSNALGKWGISGELCEKIEIHGSPERSEWRSVVKSDSSEKFLLEEIWPFQISTRKRIAQAQEELSSNGLNAVFPYLKSEAGEFVGEADGRFWMLSPFIEGLELTRPDYIYDEWRGKLLSDWLIALGKKSDEVSSFGKDAVFDLKAYCFKIYRDVMLNDPYILPQVSPIFSYLRKEDGFFENYHKLPTSFCHGDFHALNVIWGEESINAVIDWEFCGYKPELYDVANMVGCFGIENPAGLKKGACPAFIKNLCEGGFGENVGWENFTKTVLALRFAWLAEWLRKKDKEMTSLELDYMTLLLDSEKELNSSWGILD